MNDLTQSQTDAPPDKDILLKAEFNPLIRPYLVLYVAAILCSTIVGIPLALIWVCGVGQWWARHYFDKLECHLTDKTLHFRKGILIQVEKTIPLENIQDVTFLEGPILRRFNLSTIKFETAGHSAGQASNMHLTGIIDAHHFRNQILAAREALKLRNQAAPQSLASASQQEAQLAVLQGIERRLDEILRHLQSQK
jgi:putative membrane protein